MSRNETKRLLREMWYDEYDIGSPQGGKKGKKEKILEKIEIGRIGINNYLI